MAQVAVPRTRSRPQPRRKPRRGVRGVLKEMRREWTAYLFNAPGLILFVTFTLYAVVVSLWISFHDWDLIEPDRPFIGLGNYREVLGDGAFWAAIWHTVYFTVGSVIPAMAIGLGLAMLLNTQMRALGLFRAMYYLPAITPLVIAAIIWKWVYNADYGLANYYLLRLGVIDQPVQWLSDRGLAMPAVIVMGIWISVGFNMVVYLAGLQAIPAELYEAADVDGANAWQRFRRITFPLVAPTTFFLLIVQTIWGMQAFDQIFVMTNGGPPGPGGATTTVVYYLWQQGFRFFRMGYASAMAYVLFVLLFVVSFIQFRWYLKQVER
ncbi:MAG TPA: sugar ABC transporter permease [Actinomycetes bacterium]|nr:sugar ABC transporter permease [Actinomycetes bacterium]